MFTFMLHRNSLLALSKKDATTLQSIETMSIYHKNWWIAKNA